MKKSFTLKPLALSLIVAGSSVAAIAPATVQAGVSANVGAFSNYVFRGINQGATDNSPALQGGLDYEHDSGIYAGIWASTVANGYEYDLYAGWGGTVGEIDLGAGFTSYSYTDDEFEDPTNGHYQEFNLSAGYGIVGVGYDFGEDKITGGGKDKYTHTSISLDLGMAFEGLGVTYGLTKYDGDDAKSDYVDLGYGTSVEGLDLSVNYVMQGNDLGKDNFLILGVSKSFDLM